MLTTVNATALPMSDVFILDLWKLLLSAAVPGLTSANAAVVGEHLLHQNRNEYMKYTLYLYASFRNKRLI